ncbi:MAG: uroporphyrinogen-III synthase [Deltaproteobacteria bacterium]|nr:uroporphyrinogen-III synthase [Deltaproteobacteria bacterium]
MKSNIRASLRGLKVVSFESRRAKEMAELIRRYGGEPITAPSLREVPLGENRLALEFFPELEAGKYHFLILMTGIGTRTLNAVLLTKFPQERIVSALRKTHLVARGPKPVAALKELALIPSFTVPEPNTWREVLSTLDGSAVIDGTRMAVQEYGISNPKFVAALERRGAAVTTIPVYRWALPEKLAPLQQTIRQIVDGRVEVVLFTNGAQVDHLLRVAAGDNLEDALRAGFARVVIGSVGPVCTQVLRELALTPDLEPIHPKMGSLVAEAAASAGKILAAKRTVQQ